MLQPGGAFSLYSLNVIASKAYLIGEVHWSHESHSGWEFRFEQNPPKSMNGIIRIGAIIFAMVMSLKTQLMKYPIDIPACCKLRMMKQYVKNYSAVLVRPIPQQIMIVTIRGCRTVKGSSVRVFALKQMLTSYILLACSLKKTGLSCQKSPIVPIRAIMRLLTVMKKKQPTTLYLSKRVVPLMWKKIASTSKPIMTPCPILAFEA